MFVVGLEQPSQIVSLRITDRWVFVMHVLRVYCAVRTEDWKIIQDKLIEFAFVMTQAVCRRPFTAETRVWSQSNTCEVGGGQSGTVTGFSPSTSVFPCQYHSTNAPYPFIHLPPTIYNVSLPVFQFSPVSNIPPMLHTHSFTYHPHYIMFLSQYFSFPLSLPFHQCSIPIRSPTTRTI